MSMFLENFESWCNFIFASFQNIKLHCEVKSGRAVWSLHFTINAALPLDVLVLNAIVDVLMVDIISSFE